MIVVVFKAVGGAIKLGTEGAQAENEICGLASEIKTLAENIQALVCAGG